MRARLSTADLDLRPATPQDAGAIWAHASDLRVSRTLRVIPHPLPREHVDAYLARLDFARGPERVWAIRQAGEDALIGVVSADFAGSGASARLGYWLAPDRWGRGLMGQAVAAVAEALFEAGATALTAGVFADNPASLRLLARLGFVFGAAPPTRCEARGALVPYVAARLDRRGPSA